MCPVPKSHPTTHPDASHLANENDEWPEVEDEGPEEKSKSQRKREMHALQAMGKELVDMPVSQLDKLPIPEKLRDAVDQCKLMTAHGAQSRQMQFIGRIMRDIDVEPIEMALLKLRNNAQDQAQKFHQLERWRDRLVAEGDKAINELLLDFPAADRQQLRTLVRQAQKEHKEAKPPAAAREIFRVVRELMTE